MNEIIYFQPNASDPILEENDVFEIVRKYVKDVNEVDFVDETGGESRVYSINDKIILKVQRPNRLRNKTSLEKEAFFLKELEKHEEIKSPHVYGYGKYKGIEYVCMSKIKGKAFKYLEVDLKKRKNILFELGKTLYEIHSLDKKTFQESKLFPIDENLEDVLGRLNYRFVRNLKKLKGISDSELEYAKELGKNLINKITKIDCFVILHSNPALSHTYVDSNFLFSGLIDYGDSFISHPIFDIKRWNLTDRVLILKGYFYKEKPTKNFIDIYNIVYTLDSIIKILKNKGTISSIKNINDILITTNFII